MKILSHRGLWKNPDEKNTLEAFRRSFELGFGTETDIRDYCGELVVSHDIPSGEELGLEEFFKLASNYNCLTLALNIKADGLVEPLLDLIKKYNISSYFTFDMSIPEMYRQSFYDIKMFAGMSDIAKTPILIDKSSGVWLDSFISDWFDEKVISSILDLDKQVCIVSSDLHKRPNEHQWKMLRDSGLHINENIFLCTDLPEEASKYFKETV